MQSIFCPCVYVYLNLGMVRRWLHILTKLIK